MGHPPVFMRLRTLGHAFHMRQMRARTMRVTRVCAGDQSPVTDICRDPELSCGCEKSTPMDATPMRVRMFGSALFILTIQFSPDQLQWSHRAKVPIFRPSPDRAFSELTVEKEPHTHV